MPKILIADDDARMRQLLRQIVAGVANSVCEAADGGEAIAVCAAERRDWLLMDWRIKPTDGLQATAEIKARFAAHPQSVYLEPVPKALFS